MTVGFFSPLPPARTGVADYSAALLGALRGLGPVEVNAADADVALYHIGNNLLHREIYQRAITHPGVVVLHDAALNHFFLGTLSADEYVEEFVYNYGEWERGLAQDLWKNRARSAADPRYFDYPMLRRIVRNSLAVIVHNPAAVTAVLRHMPEARVIEIPHLFVPPELPDAIERTRFRAGLGLGPRTLLAGVFGHLRESKRLPAILRAMERVWKTDADVKLLVQGAFESTDLERSMAPLIQGKQHGADTLLPSKQHGADTLLPSKPRILRAGALPEREFWRWASAADVCINLRFPRAAESSGIAVRMMGIGKTVIFTEGEEIARLPRSARLAVETGVGEEALLADYLLWLAGDGQALLEIGRRARAHIARQHALEKVAAQYWETLRMASLNTTASLNTKREIQTRCLPASPSPGK